MPWDKDQCTHGPGVNCSGPRGCVVREDVAVAWNKSAPARWSELHRAAAARVRRRVGEFRIVERAWEPQRRGVLHQNVLTRSTSPRERVASKLYRQALTELAPAYGFGQVSQRADVRDSVHGGRYIAKYLAKSESAGKLGIADVAMRADCPGRIAWVDPGLTSRTGESIRACRERRVVWRLASIVAGVRPDVGCSIEDAEHIRRVHQTGRLFAELRARARKRRVLGEDWNRELWRAHAENDHEARWLQFHLAKLGMAPELYDGA